MKHKHAIQMVVLWLLILTPALGWAATYYVDNNKGNDSNSGAINIPFKTIDKGASVLKPGDTLLVREGVYREKVNIKVSGTKENPIVIKAFPNEKPVLEGSLPLTDWVKCKSQEDFPENKYWENIYYAYVDSSAIPDIDHFVLYENGEFLQRAQDPNQSNINVEQVGDYRPLETESFGLTDYLIDTDFLVQPDDYWNGCYIRIWSHAYNNAIIDRKIADYIQSEHKIIFDQPLAHPISSGSQPDAYSIINHPSLLDKPGEFAYTMTPDSNGKYKIYLWPRNISSLNGKIAISSINVAIYFGGSSGYVTIDGFEIRQYFGSGTRSGGIICPYGFNHTGVILRNNHIHDINGYGGIAMSSGDHDLVENNIVRNIRGDLGIMIGPKYPRVIGNYVENTEHTCIYLPGAQYGQILYNTVGAGGNHANAITVYQGGDKVLIAYNKTFKAARPITISSSSNIYIYNNLLHGDGGYLIADWGEMSGEVVIVNNTISGSNNSASLYVHSADRIIVKNNIIDGGWAGEHSNNIYTKLSWNQVASHGFNLAESEIVEKDIAKIYMNPDDLNFQLCENSPAIDAGIDVRTYLHPEYFPGVDLSKDLNGNRRWNGSRVDIGAYEYSSGNHQEVNTHELIIRKNVMKKGETIIIDVDLVENAFVSIIFYDRRSKR